MNLGKVLTDWKGNLGTLWLWIGAALLLLNLFVVGIASWAFWYGLTYSLGWIGLGIVLSVAKPRVLGAVCAALGGALAVVLSLQALAFITSQMAAGLSVVLFAGVILSESNMLKFGGCRSEAKYVTLLAFGSSALFGLLYFYNRLTSGLPLNYETVMYHGGIMLLAGFDFVTVLGAVKFGASSKIRLVLAVAAIFGAVLVTGVLGWGLTLTP
ncbi:hypothetical protein MUP01_10750 [Candidatus Bathyarchaeota archaeon]|nr:hypothetical protein [Candidatus Bathyarchaeota archaeon]